MIATRLAGGGLPGVSASASGSSTVRRSKRTIFDREDASRLWELKLDILCKGLFIGRCWKSWASGGVVHGAASVGMRREADETPLHTTVQIVDRVLLLKDNEYVSRGSNSFSKHEIYCISY
jgi:hypothetical protein